MGFTLLEKARQRSGLTQDDLARRAGTSRPTLSAYEHGHKSPTLETVDRLVAAAGFDLDIAPHIRWSKVVGARGQIHHVPDQLFRLPVDQALATFQAPLHLDWSKADRMVNLADRKSRIRWYEIVLREGSAGDIRTYIDGALLLDAWSEMIVPRLLRTHWQTAINRSLEVGNE